MPTTSDVFGSLCYHIAQQSRAFVWRHMHTANSRLGVSPECVAEERVARGVVVYEIDTEQQLHHHERFLACRLQTSALGVVPLKGHNRVDSHKGRVFIQKFLMHVVPIGC